MTRMMCIVVVLAACGKKPDSTKNLEGSGFGTASTNMAHGEPASPPPPPTIKPGKGDCKPEYAPRPTRDPNPMCKIAGGVIKFESFLGEMTVQLSPYLIDQFEVTNAQVAHYLNATKADKCAVPTDARNPCFRVGTGTDADRTNQRLVTKLSTGHYAAVPGMERLAYTGASRQGALEYCAWAGKHLPTESQWVFAARRDPVTGKDYLYPWGDEFDGTRARCRRSDCPDAPIVDLASDPADARTVAVGSFDGSDGRGDGRSPWGAHDMAGNANELVADCDYAYKPCDSGICVDPAPHGPSDGVCRKITRGGGVNLRLQMQTTNRGQAPIPGFRCAK